MGRKRPAAIGQKRPSRERTARDALLGGSVVNLLSVLLDRTGAGQPLEGLRCKNLGNETHSLVNRKRTLRALGGNNARAFLATMLQRKKAIIHDARGVRMPENGEDTAFVGGFGFLEQGLGRWTRAGKWSVHAAFQGLNEPARPLSQASSMLLKSLFSDSLSVSRYSTVCECVVVG